ncbi:MAG: FmdB family zinc ribbon protein [Planctomycetota bacterium]
MPIYEYKCSECGRVNEFLESLSSKAGRKCGYCGGRKLTRQFSVFSAGVKQGDSKRCHGCSDSVCPHAGRQV